MDGIRVGNRIIGRQAPVTIGWENIPKVEGGPVKQFFFTYFQPVALLALILFWYYAPNSIAKASTAIWISVGFKALLLVLEWVNPRYESWKLTWKEMVTDLFYVGLGYTLIRYVDKFVGSDAIVEYIQGYFHFGKLHWFMDLPILLQAFLISFIFDFGQYWMHRGMHNWYPLWLPHSVHHYITQLNVNKGAVGNPLELFLIGLGMGGFFDFVPRAFLIAGAMTMGISVYQHINVRFNTPRWWRYLFNTVEHHSLHHSRDFEASRSNFSNTYIFIDRIFGTCVDGEAELLGMEGGRRMSVREQMTHPYSEAFRIIRKKYRKRFGTQVLPVRGR
ncbi:sterol desaturase family protein [Acidomonas methanolica]|uniref:sterol desaturase family protein n=1 Tax=Acidomonas methanolica TaxID=437 RepID=UPI00211A45D0|nr:sterol desaturase family protein [Acidomonas methanolica]MCQ9157055.1 sterol desaturase family protein [Acidomonas methanolica]